MIKNQEACGILQATDLHLLANHENKFLGINPHASWEAALDLIKQVISEKNIALLLLTGDLSHDHDTATYQNLAKSLQDISIPILWTSGNHDDPHKAADAFSSYKITNKKSYLLQNWQIILLNTHWPEHIAGRLPKSELHFLQQKLNEHPDKYTLLFLHHHTVPSNSHWLDTSILDNRDDLLSIIYKHNNIKAVICGHIHQESLSYHNNIPFIATPSTSVQFKSNSKSFALDTMMPGFRWFNIYHNGTLATGVTRIPYSTEFIPDTSSTGY